MRAGSLEVSAQPCLLAPENLADFTRTLEDLAAGRAPDTLAFARAAWRFAALAFFRYSLPFPLVKQIDWYMDDFNFDSHAVLAPGQDAMLDRICAHVTDGSPLHDSPPARSAADSAAETAGIAHLIAAARPGKMAARTET